MKIIYTYTWILLILFKYIVSAIEISLVGFIYTPDERLSCIKDEFNKYAQENNLDITLNTLYYTYRNSTGNVSSVSDVLEEYTKTKEKSEYDIFLIDTIYSGHYAEHFEDLQDRLPNDILDLYKNGIATMTGLINKRLVSMPLYVDYGGLFYNPLLLEKYNKTVPKTWDELIETFTYIYDQETALGIPMKKFMGLPDGEAGVAATLEMIHSFRKKVNDPFPGYLSDEAFNALEKMKEVKKKISDNDSFSMKQEYVWNRLYNDRDNYIFFRAWYTEDIDLPELGTKPGLHLRFAPLPGNTPGISGSCIGGSNLALNKYISEEKKKAAIEIYKFLFSYDFQKYLVLNVGKRSAIHSLYKDAEVCQKINCAMYSQMQGLIRPTNSTKSYEKFSSKFFKYMKEYIIYDEISSKEALKKIDNIESVHYVERTSILAIVFYAIAGILILIILSLYFYISIKRSRKEFKFLPFNYWCFFLFGILILIVFSVTFIGNFNKYVCLLRINLLTFGYTFTYVPLLIKLLCISPYKNGLTSIININYNIILTLFIIMDIGLNLAWYIFDPVQIDIFYIEEGENFKICRSKGKIGRIITYIFIIKAIAIDGAMIHYVLSERNLTQYKKDILNVGNALYISTVNALTIIVTPYIANSNRYSYYGIRGGITMTFCITNIVFIIFPRVYSVSFKKKKTSRFSRSSNFNRFIEKTGAFNSRSNMQKELKFINMDDFVEKNYYKYKILNENSNNQSNTFISSNDNNYINFSVNKTPSSLNQMNNNTNFSDNTLNSLNRINNNNFTHNTYSLDRMSNNNSNSTFSLNRINNSSINSLNRMNNNSNSNSLNRNNNNNTYSLNRINNNNYTHNTYSLDRMNNNTKYSFNMINNNNNYSSYSLGRIKDYNNSNNSNNTKYYDEYLDKIKSSPTSAVPKDEYGHELW